MSVQTLSDLSKSTQIVPTSVEFVDIAGLVKGASKGEGLGNQFLANIRECDAIAQVHALYRPATFTKTSWCMGCIETAVEFLMSMPFTSVSGKALAYIADWRSLA